MVRVSIPTLERSLHLKFTDKWAPVLNNHRQTSYLYSYYSGNFRKRVSCSSPAQRRMASPGGTQPLCLQHHATSRSAKTKPPTHQTGSILLLAAQLNCISQPPCLRGWAMPLSSKPFFKRMLVPFCRVLGDQVYRQQHQGLGSTRWARGAEPCHQHLRWPAQN